MSYGCNLDLITYTITSGLIRLSLRGLGGEGGGGKTKSNRLVFETVTSGICIVAYSSCVVLEIYCMPGIS